MPEGDTTARTAADLRRWIVGKTVTGARPRQLQRLIGHSVTAVDPVGKHLFIGFDHGLELHSHMQMTGAWHVYSAGQRWRRGSHRATAILDFGSTQAVLFDAPLIELVAAGRAAVNHLGPDILAPPVDWAEVLRRAAASDVTTVGELLLDQTVCAGIGNIYKCESLFARGIDPWALPTSLPDDALRRCIAQPRR